MIKITSNIKQAIEAHAEKTYPYECCGFLFGLSDQQERSVLKTLEVKNTHKEDQRRRFLIAPKQYLEAEKFADENNLELIGIYHSHPDHPSLPSEHDRKQAMPTFSYFIQSVKSGKSDSLQSWVLDTDFQFQEEKIIYN